MCRERGFELQPARGAHDNIGRFGAYVLTGGAEALRGGSDELEELRHEVKRLRSEWQREFACGRHRWRGRARSGNPGCFVRNRGCRTAPQTGNVQRVRTCWTRDTPDRQQIHRQLELRLNDRLRGGHDRAALE